MRIRDVIKESDEACGDCFEAAGRNMIYKELPGINLVHAYVSGQGPLEGRRFEHAWNEIGDVVIDNSNGRRVVMRREQYYALGKVDQSPGQYARYNEKQALAKIVKHKHWGPWDLS